MAKLSQHFPEASVIRDADFTTLGYVDAHHAGVIAFCDTIKYARLAAKNPSITCLITTPALVPFVESIPGVVSVDQPRDAFYQLHEAWVHEKRYQYPFEAHLGSHCRIHPSAIIAPGCHIGDHVTIGEHVVIREAVFIGSHVIIEPGVKLGTEGILYHRTEDGPRLIPHGGYLRIEDHAALMSNSVVVRSVHDTDMTQVGRAAIIGLGSVVGHEAKVGDHVVVSNQCVLARRCRIGKGAFIGTSSFIREHVQVGERAQIMAGSVVINDVAESAVVSGNFASDHKRRMLQFAKELRQGQAAS
ncbi:MAG: hypothetical protein OJI67_16580 [Prosthecobacter sp.]|nr:hypothetical protein [Prosthecobacter sp.]